MVNSYMETMSLKSVISKYSKLVLAVSVVIVGIIYREEIEELYKNLINGKNQRKTIDGVFSEVDLVLYNGVKQDRLYLAVLGSVFDVTKGKKNYAKDAPYNYFVGKDGSRALVTGNFKDESSSKDHVMDLSCNDLFSLLQWRDTFRNKYKHVGVLAGRYYKENGDETAYMQELKIKIYNCKEEKEIAKAEEQKYPPCNSAWDAEEGTKVWCTKTSGGVTRSWVGVPRQLYTPGSAEPRCACVNLEADNSGALLKEFDNCSQSSTTCILG